jgi:Phage integrase, N-terminal SAM-like domain
MTGPSLTHSPRACRTQRVVVSDGERTWTVLDGDHRVAEPAEQFLEYLRMLGRSPNTVKSYARALALWWQFLSVYELAWNAVTVEDLGPVPWLVAHARCPCVAGRPSRPPRPHWRHSQAHRRRGQPTRVGR